MTNNNFYFYFHQVMDVQLAQLWFSGKEMLRGMKIKDFVGKNEKTKAVVKLHKRGSGRPAREPLMSEDEKKQLMLHAYKRQEELKVSIHFFTIFLLFFKLLCIYIYYNNIIFKVVPKCEEKNPQIFIMPPPEILLYGKTTRNFLY